MTEPEIHGYFTRLAFWPLRFQKCETEKRAIEMALMNGAALHSGIRIWVWQARLLRDTDNPSDEDFGPIDAPSVYAIHFELKKLEPTSYGYSEVEVVDE